MYPAARGLPGKEVNTMSPMFGLVSRYHRMVLENGLMEVPPCSVFFFECPSDKLRDDWLKCYYINQEWAQRFSGMFYPRGSARVEYGEGVWRMKVHSDNSVRYLKSSRLHVSTKTDGTIYKKGSKFASAWKPRYAQLKGQCTLEYYAEKGGELLGKVNMADGRIVLVCNDTLTPPAGASTKEKLSNLRGKIGGGRRTSIAEKPVGAGTATKEERAENLLWFAIMNPGRVWLFKAANLEDLERWMFSIEDRCNEFKQLQAQIRTAIKTAEEEYDRDPAPIRYKLHVLSDSCYPQLERAAIPGRPMSGQFTHEDPMKLTRSTAVSAASMGGGASPRVRGMTTDSADFDDATVPDMDEELEDLKIASKPEKKPLPSPAATAGGSRKGDASPRIPQKPESSPRGKPGGSTLRGGAKDDSDELDDFSDDSAKPGLKKASTLAAMPEARSPRGGKPMVASAKSSSNLTGSSSSPSSSSSSSDALLKEKDAQLEEKVKALETIRAQFTTMKEEYRNNKLLVKKQERDIERLQEELNEAKESGGGGGDGAAAELEEARKALAEAEQKLKQAEKQVKKLTNENEKLQATAGAKDGDDAEVADLKKQVAELEEKIAQLDTQLDESKRTARDGKKAIDELEREKKKREALEKKTASLQTDLDKMEAEVEALREQKHALEDQVAASKAASSDPKEVQAVKKERDTALKKIAVLELRVSTAEQEAARARQTATAAAKRRSYSGFGDDAMRDVVRALNEENDTLIAQLSAVKAASSAAKPSSAEVAALQRDLQLALKTLDIASDRLEKLEQENKALRKGAPPSASAGGGSSSDGAAVKKLEAENAELKRTIENQRKEIEQHVKDKGEMEQAFIAMQEESQSAAESAPAPAVVQVEPPAAVEKPKKPAIPAKKATPTIPKKEPATVKMVPVVPDDNYDSDDPFGASTVAVAEMDDEW